MMIENHHSLNVAGDGKHMVRIELPASLSSAQAREQAQELYEALHAFYGPQGVKIECGLSYVSCSSRSVDYFKPED